MPLKVTLRQLEPVLLDDLWMDREGFEQMGVEATIDFLVEEDPLAFAEDLGGIEAGLPVLLRKLVASVEWVES